jgi:hypothetical protein
MQKFEPFHTLILRSPNFSIKHLKQLDKKKILEFYNIPSVKEALLIASPSLLSTLVQYNSGKLIDKKKIDNLFFSLTKYMLRMTSRCTPFGLFAACSTVNLGDTTNIKLHREKTIKRHVRLDHGYLTQLVNLISNDKAVRDKLKYFPNSTLYKQGPKWRYVEFDYIDNKRVHKISSFQNEDYFDMIFNNLSKGFYINELFELLNNFFDTDEKEIYDFIASLIDSQIIISELLINVSGEDYLSKTIKTLQKYSQTWASSLNKINNNLALLNTTEIGSNGCFYDAIIDALNDVDVPFDKRTVFQADTFKPLAYSTISPQIINNVKQGIEFLSRFSTSANQIRLQAFTTAFTQRYEKKEVALVLALDPEAGIGYQRNTSNGDVSPLLDDLVINELVIPKIETDIVFNFLFKKLTNALINNQFEVKIEEIDLKDFPIKPVNLPDTFAVIVSVLSHALHDGHEEVKLLMNNPVITGGGRYIGRFCHLDASIEQLCRDIANNEDGRFDGIRTAWAGNIAFQKV